MESMCRSDQKYFEKVLENNAKKILLVCGLSGSRLEVTRQLLQLPVQMVPFMDFAPNPTYESVVKGVEIFRKEQCESILVIGGGSAIDVAKCIKLFATMDPERDYLKQELKTNDILLFAVPTTAGTGSEATQFAVIYRNGEKQSISHTSLIPEYVLFKPESLSTLPLYQRKATMLDALCHAVEAFWSVHSTKLSREYSAQAIREILKHEEGYFHNRADGNAGMLYAAHLAGKAINITRTTAAHAMCYKLTTLYGLAHGHAAALCLVPLWEYMINHMEECCDERGADFVGNIFDQIASLLGCDTPKDGVSYLKNKLVEWNFAILDGVIEQLPLLVESINQERLQNNPVKLSKSAIKQIYRDILSNKAEKNL